MTNDDYELDERLFSIVGNSPDVDAIREIIDEQLREAERRGDALVGTQGSQQTIWREDDRIRGTDGTGYSDMVGDEQIRQHIVSMDDDFFAAFAEAVLAIRAFERASTAASAVSSVSTDSDFPAAVNDDPTTSGSSPMTADGGGEPVAWCAHCDHPFAAGDRLAHDCRPAGVSS